MRHDAYEDLCFNKLETYQIIFYLSITYIHELQLQKLTKCT